MSDFPDDLLAEAVREFRAKERLLAEATPGTQAVRAAVASRRRNLAVTLVAAAVLAVAVPIGVFASLSASPHEPPLATISPTGSPSQPALSADDLTAARVMTVGFAGLACPARVGPAEPGDVDFDVYVHKAVPANLDPDPELETAALVVCGLPDGYRAMVMGYERDQSGAIVSLGLMVPQGYLTDIQQRPAGGVIVTVAYDASMLAGRPEPQRREFAWRDGRFTQVDGPNTFIKPDIDLSISAIGGLVWPAPGKTTSTLDLRVINKSGQDAPALRIQLVMPGLVSVSAGDSSHVVEMQGPMAANTLDLTLTLEVDPAATPDMLTLTLYAYVDDPVPADNVAQVIVLRS